MHGASVHRTAKAAVLTKPILWRNFGEGWRKAERRPDVTSKVWAADFPEATRIRALGCAGCTRFHLRCTAAAQSLQIPSCATKFAHCQAAKSQKPQASGNSPENLRSSETLQPNPHFCGCASSVSASSALGSPYLSWWRIHAMGQGRLSSSRPLGVRSRKLYAFSIMSSPRAYVE